MAGVLSTLSPCVLPLLPIVLGGAASEHKLAPAALAAGLALSFASIGLFVATVGFSVGLDASVFRSAAAVMLIGLGVVLAVPSLQQRFAVAAGPAAFRPRAFRDNSASACCWAPSGARVRGRRWGPPRCSPRRASGSAKWR